MNCLCTSKVSSFSSTQSSESSATINSFYLTNTLTSIFQIRIERRLQFFEIVHFHVVLYFKLKKKLNCAFIELFMSYYLHYDFFLHI